jgi:hypothetical protein
MRRDASSPEAYRADVVGEQSEFLEAIRSIILEVAPDVREAIGHGMLDYPGLANLAAQKDFVALYVAATVLTRRKGDFPGVSAGKSCLRFRRLAQLDREALARLLREVHAFRREESGEGS